MALVAVWTVFVRGRRDAGALLTASATAVLAFVVFGQVVSPQYMIWLVPLVPLVPLVAGRARRPAAGLLAAALVLTQIWSQSRYHEVVAGQPIVWFVLARDLVLVAVFVVLAVAVYRGGNQTSKPSVRTRV